MQLRWRRASGVRRPGAFDQVHLAGEGAEGSLLKVDRAPNMVKAAVLLLGDAQIFTDLGRVGERAELAKVSRILQKARLEVLLGELHAGPKKCRQGARRGSMWEIAPATKCAAPGQTSLQSLRAMAGKGPAFWTCKPAST